METHSQKMRLTDLNNNLRKLWFEHVMWTRIVIMGIAYDLKDLEVSAARLLQNPGDFAEIFKEFYGDEKADKFKKLFTDHLTIAGDLVAAAKKGNNIIAENKRIEWYKNADEISIFLSELNPNWSEAQWKEMMHQHLMMTEEEAKQILTGKYKDSINQFDKISQEAMEMADVMIRGLVRQFYLRH